MMVEGEPLRNVSSGASALSLSTWLPDAPDASLGDMLISPLFEISPKTVPNCEYLLHTVTSSLAAQPVAFWAYDEGEIKRAQATGTMAKAYLAGAVMLRWSVPTKNNDHVVGYKIMMTTRTGITTEVGYGPAAEFAQSPRMGEVTIATHARAPGPRQRTHAAGGVRIKGPLL